MYVKRRLPPSINPVIKRQRAILAIGRMGSFSAQTERAIVIACHDNNSIVRDLAVQILFFHGSQSSETVVAVREGLKDTQIRQRIVLGSYRSFGIDYEFRTVEEMALGLTRPLQEIRYQAACALRELGTNARPAIPALITACDDSEDKVRVCCMKTLGRIGPAASNAIPALQKSLQQQSLLIRSVAQEAISQINDTRQKPSPEDAFQ
jgi:HEAT repeat protein